jgi:hypothetical protein
MLLMSFTRLINMSDKKTVDSSPMGTNIAMILPAFGSRRKASIWLPNIAIPTDDTMAIGTKIFNDLKPLM